MDHIPLKVFPYSRTLKSPVVITPWLHHLPSAVIKETTKSDVDNACSITMCGVIYSFYLINLLPKHAFPTRLQLVNAKYGRETRNTAVATVLSLLSKPLLLECLGPLGYPHFCHLKNFFCLSLSILWKSPSFEIKAFVPSNLESGGCTVCEKSYCVTSTM